jgi:Spy/CpxP family protein refolding chaperone
MKIRIAISVSIVAVLAVVLIATAQSRTASCQAPQRPAGGPPPPPPPLMNEHLARELNLSDEQNAQVKAVFDAEHATVEGLMKKLDDLREQLRAATANGQFDEAQVRSLANQQGQTQADLIVEHERTKAKIYSLLTAEQRSKLEQLHERMKPPFPGPRPPDNRPPER